jgi:hypothetical protein
MGELIHELLSLSQLGSRHACRPSAPRIAYAAPLVRSETTHPNLAHALEQATVAAAYHHQAPENVKKTAVTTASRLSRLVSLSIAGVCRARRGALVLHAHACPAPRASLAMGPPFATSLYPYFPGPAIEDG